MPDDMVQTVLEQGMLYNWKRYGWLARCIFGMRNGVVDRTVLIMGDTADAHAAAREMARDGCDGVAHVSEGWIAYRKKGDPPGPRPQDLPPDDRGEAMLLTVAYKTGEWYAVSYDIDRATRKPVNRRVKTDPPRQDRILGGIWD